MRIAAVVLAGCHALPPPPLVAPLAPLDLNERGAVTAMIVVGAALQGIGGGGVGLGLRVERQTTEHTTLGFEVTGGRGDEILDDTGAIYHQWLLGARFYGRRITPAGGGDLTGYTYGAGLAWMRSGAWVAQLHAGVVGNLGGDRFEPMGGFGLALAVPIDAGHAYGDVPFHLNFGEPEPPHVDKAEPELGHPETELYAILDFGGAAKLSSNALTFDLAIAFALRAKQAIFAITLADSQRF